MDSEYIQHYRTLYERHWWWRARENLILKTIERVRPTGSWNSILDIGCGDGFLFDQLSRFGDVEGIEINQNLVTSGGPWENKIHIGSFDATFQPNKNYSLILMLDVLEHFADPRPCLRRAVDLLQPDGVLLITVPAFNCLWTSHDNLNHHYTRYTKIGLTQLMTTVGIRVYTSRYFFHWIFPIKLVIRLLEELFLSSPKIPRVPLHWLNEIAYHFSFIEQKIFSRLPIPFGTSLFIVAGRG